MSERKEISLVVITDHAGLTETLMLLHLERRTCARLLGTLLHSLVLVHFTHPLHLLSAERVSSVLGIQCVQFVSSILFN